MAGGALAGPSKKAAEEGATIIWVDESAFYLLPHLVRTWAPRGLTPRLDVKQTKDHLSAISGITLDGRLFLQVREGSYSSAAVVGFLRVLLRKLPGRIILIWDGSPIHRGHAIRDFLRGGTAKRLHVEQLPGYAPDLNPDEGIWNYLKRVELANVCCRDLDELRTQVIRARERLRHKRDIIRACAPMRVRRQVRQRERRYRTPHGVSRWQRMAEEGGDGRAHAPASCGAGPQRPLYGRWGAPGDRD